MEQVYEAILEILPPELREAVGIELAEGGVEEIRLRCGIPATINRGGSESALFCKGRPVTPDAALLQAVLEAASDHSVHTAAEAMARGYVTLRGGSRVGLCGRAVVLDGRVKTISPVSSLNIRAARQHPGCASALIDHLAQQEESLLILGPPGCGKTTLLRDAARLLSDRLDRRVGLADTRGELAALWAGAPQMNVGRRTDVLADCPVALAVPMLVRTMNPAWVCIDEITDPEDIAAIERASYCGVHFLATAHAACVEDLGGRPLYRRLLKLGLFRWAAVLGPSREVHIQKLKPQKGR